MREIDVLEASQARVHASDGEVVGAAFLVAEDVLCTCAHVVTRALGLPGAEEPSESAVEFDFPLLPGRPRMRATVKSWRTGGADVALLRLDEPVEGTRPAPLVDGTGVWGHAFRAMGFPAGASQGVWVYGTLRAETGAGWLQMETEEPGPRIAEGFSGAPVWDETQNGVVGMTVTAHLGERTAYLLPSADLVDETTLKPRCPFQGLAAFTEEDAEFFHGRAADTERLIDAVLRRPLTLVAGPSGCGKSSLVHAGVLRRLRAAGADVTELRPIPGTRPTSVVARALVGVLEPELGEIERLARAETLVGLLDTGDGITTELRAKVLARSSNFRHVLFVDQLEEYVGADPAAGRTLFGLLADLAGGELRVVATARPDSLDVLNTAGTSDLVSDAVQFLAPLAAENLEQAVTAPVDATPGLWFEAGLPERIVADAGNEPGRMPLVQFALTELWQRRSRAMLTHAAYDDLGGVAGALVGYADQTFEQLPSSEQSRAQRLFIQLARPGQGGTFTRRPTPTADLAPELVAVARRLAPGKLVVLSRAPGGDEREELVDLAHEALTTHWPLLLGWLTESRDFRRRQEQVRADLARWHTQQREPARLLSGTDLAEAERWLKTHPAPDDISAAEREYVRLSGNHARRGARLRQAAMAALGVLTVLAVVLSFTTYQNLQRAEEHLRAQAAGLLAQATDRRPPHDAAAALQLALAAWHTGHTPDTRQALMNQYVRAQYVTATYPSLWRGNVSSLYASEDGRTLVAASKPSGGEQSTLTVVTGALGGTPHVRELSGVPKGALKIEVSPDGRFVAAHGAGGVHLWRTGGGGAKSPAVLEPGPYELPERVEVGLDFSSDSRRLLLAIGSFDGCATSGSECTSAFVNMWETDSGDRMRVSNRIVLRHDLNDVAFTRDADSAVIVHSDGDGTAIQVRDLESGHRLYSRRVTTSPSLETELRAGGEIVVNGETRRALALGRTPGRPYEVLGGQLADATTRYTVAYPTLSDEAEEKGGYAEQVLIDVRTGHTFRTRVPDSGDASVLGSGVAVVPREGGGLTVLAAVGSDLLELRAEPVGGKRFGPNYGDGNEALSPNGQFLARVDENRLEILDASRERLRSVHLPEAAPSGEWEQTWTADSQHLVLWGRDGRLNRSYAMGDTGSRSLPLDDALRDFDQVRDVVGIGGSEVAVISDDADIARIDAADGEVTTQPFSVHQPADDNMSLNGVWGGHRLVARPKHPGQVAVVTAEGAERGEILLWDLRGPRRVDVLRGSPVASFAEHLMDGPYRAKFAFNPSGTHLAVVNQDSLARIWDVPNRKQSTRGVPWTTEDGLAGLTPDRVVVTYRGGRFHFLDPAHRGSDLAVPAVTGMGQVDGHQLVVDSGTVRQNFDLRPEVQFRALCDAVGRDYTEAERELLPEGTPDEPPCS
ncbi:trypsin-like peptidase domain-containing protein [Streptomyces sp. NPDC005791]|uniref:nSTAND1 domain-containing NTPase n=1 Tax=Streptomyces sp. NPDC005791 TaxID=3364732 RepID=UPI0036B35214